MTAPVVAAPTVVDERPPLRDVDDPAWKRTAHHEAAHCVIALVFNARFDHVTLRPRNPGWRGAVIGYKSGGRPLVDAAVWAAGVAGVVLTEPGHDIPRLLRTAGKLDFCNIESLGLAEPAVESIIWRVCRTLHAHRDAVAAIAHQLLTHSEQELRYRQVVDILEDHSPGGLSWTLRQYQDQLARQEMGTPT